MRESHRTQPCSGERGRCIHGPVLPTELKVLLYPSLFLNLVKTLKVKEFTIYQNISCSLVMSLDNRLSQAINILTAVCRDENNTIDHNQMFFVPSCTAYCAAVEDVPNIDYVISGYSVSYSKFRFPSFVFQVSGPCLI